MLQKRYSQVTTSWEIRKLSWKIITLIIITNIIINHSDLAASDQLDQMKVLLDQFFITLIGLCQISKFLAPVVQTMDSAVHRINHYPADKHYQNQLSYPVDSDLSSG